VRLTEFWRRMELVLGTGYAESWASDHVVAGLQGATVREALAAGVDTKTVWRAVAADLQLPPGER
jgi:Protein of unknown function (DUF3046)